MDYFGCKSQKLPSAGSSAPRPALIRRSFKLDHQRICKILILLNNFGDADAWKFGTKRNLYFVFSTPPPCSKNVSAPLQLVSIFK